MNKLARMMTIGAVFVSLAGCGFESLDTVTLPGSKGTGDDAMVVTAHLPDVGTLTENAQVKVDEVVVGTVIDLEVESWHAVATLSLEPGTDLPENVEANVGVNSLLGSAYVELTPPTTVEPIGALGDDAVIPLERGGAYPDTEQVLSSASLVLNGGGFEQLSTITTELNRALGGEHAVGDLLPRLESFVGALDDQRSEIKSTIRALDSTAKTFADGRQDITRALDEIGPALAVLARERPNLTKALTSLRRLSDVAVPLVAEVKQDLIDNLEDITPALQALRQADASLVRGLGFAVTFPFAPETVNNACRSSYCNLNLILDLTNGAITDGFIGPDGGLNIPNLPGLPDLPNVNLPDILGQVTDPVKNLTDALTGQGQQGATAPAETLGELLGGLNLGLGKPLSDRQPTGGKVPR